MLTDQFGRRHSYLRVSVTDRCNLRCSYCIPHAGVEWRDRTELLSLEEILRVITILTKHGVEKVRFTGGEPLLRDNLTWLIKQVVALPSIRFVGLTTNGVKLASKVKELQATGLNAINISLDSLKQERFRRITGFDQMKNVMDGLEASLSVGIQHVKMNVVMMRGVNDDELFDFVEFVRNRAISLRFIEYMPFKGTHWDATCVLPYQELFERLTERYILQPRQLQSSATSKEYDLDGFMGSIGFITPLSSHFCDQCNRIRLTADGAIKSCLFHPAELSLRDMIRSGASDAELVSSISDVLHNKQAEHNQEQHTNVNRPMYDTGG